MVKVRVMVRVRVRVRVCGWVRRQHGDALQMHPLVSTVAFW